MKTVNLASFTNDKMKEKELNFLKGGFTGSDDPIKDLLMPPQR